MPKRKPEFYEVLICEIRKYTAIDVMFGKALRVLGEAK